MKEVIRARCFHAFRDRGYHEDRDLIGVGLTEVAAKQLCVDHFERLRPWAESTTPYSYQFGGWNSLWSDAWPNPHNGANVYRRLAALAPLAAVPGGSGTPEGGAVAYGMPFIDTGGGTCCGPWPANTTHAERPDPGWQYSIEMVDLTEG